MRVINYKPYDFSTELLYSESILSLNQLQNYEAILSIFKILNNLIRSPVPWITLMLRIHTDSDFVHQIQDRY